MNGIDLPIIRYRLGAEELIELGRRPESAAVHREPFLAGRARGGRRPYGNVLGEIADRTGGFILDALDRGLGFLCGMTGLPADLSAGADLVAGSAEDLLVHVPRTGDVMAQVLLLGSAAVKFGLPLPEARARALQGLGMALASRQGEEDRRALVEEAKRDIVKGASGDLKADVMKVLDATTADPPAVGTAGPVIPRQPLSAT